MHPALDDPEHCLVPRPVLAVPLEAAVEPTVGALGRAGRVVAVGVIRRALIEGEGDVGAELGLDRHRLLRSDEAIGAVEQGLERDAPFGDLHDGTAMSSALRLGIAGPSGSLSPASLDLVRDSAVGEREHLEPT